MPTTALPMLDAMLRCAGCHDQCMTATAEAAASGHQARLVSRVATLGLHLADGRAQWDAESAESLFFGLNDGLQAEYCIYRSEGHRIEPYLRRLRAEAVQRGLAPQFVREAAAAIASTGNIFRLAVPSIPSLRTGGVVLLHDTATAAFSPASVAAARQLLALAGMTCEEAWIGSAGTIENDLGLSDAAEIAAANAVAEVAAMSCQTIVSTDPVLVARLQLLLAGQPNSPRVLHICEALRDAQIQFRSRETKVAIHDDGTSGRLLHLSDAVRELVRRVPGLSLVEPVNAGARASSDGPLAVYPDPRLADAIARRRREELDRAGADLILTMSPYSLANLRSVGGAAQVEDLTVFLEELGMPA